jgi:dTMP kinase
MPDLTILLDLPPHDGLGRRTRSMDRLEAEPSAFHERVRAGFLGLAHREPERYLVVDATRPPAELTAEIEDRLRDLLPDPVPVVSEADTGSFPAITDAMPVTSHRRA